MANNNDQVGQAWAIVHNHCRQNKIPCRKVVVQEGPAHATLWILTIIIRNDEMYVGAPATSQNASLRIAALKAATALGLEVSE
ncbi:hypothetical protein FRB94_002947 [Tulasnella sp. JGI-2019a]|nr:hypothetical protein FRB94_002947 [Tulasnella sp. JGI-2019a]